MKVIEKNIQTIYIYKTTYLALEMCQDKKIQNPQTFLIPRCEPRTIRSSKLTGVMADESTNGVGRGRFDTIEVHY